MRRYLIVANKTLAGQPLKEKLEACVKDGPCTFHVVAPATPPLDDLTWTEGEVHDIARRRLDVALAWFHEIGAEATGEVGDEDPLLAIEDALKDGAFDEIILSTLPAGASKWIGMDLPSKMKRRAEPIPVVHVIGEPSPADPEEA